MGATRTKSSLTASQRREVHQIYLVYRNTGSVSTGKWVFQPRDYDASFELYSEPYDTRREAVEAAYADIAGYLRHCEWIDSLEPADADA